VGLIDLTALFDFVRLAGRATLTTAWGHDTVALVILIINNTHVPENPIDHSRIRRCLCVVSLTCAPC
jgi:hypothetical protein